VTIAAGFKFDDGLVICADTQQTYSGVLKLNATKLVPINFAHNGRSQVIFAIAGSVRYARMAVQKIQAAIAGRTPEDMTLLGIFESIETELLAFHKAHIHPHPRYGMSGSPEFQLLIGAWSHIDGMGLFMTDDTAVNGVDDYACVGTGEYLAHYLAKPLYQSTDLELNEIVALATHILLNAKVYVDGCGGNSEFIVLHKDGQLSPVKWFDISQGESYSQDFEQAMQLVFYAAADLKKSDDDLKAAIAALTSLLESGKAQRAQAKERRDKLIKALSGRIKGTSNATGTLSP
jgi:20S proteasome alpha/beta subunit